MTRKNIAILVCVFIVWFVINAAAYYFLLLETFDMFGIQAIVDPESLDQKVFYTALLLTILNVLVFADIKRKFNNASYLFLIFLVVSSGLFIKTAFSFLDKSTYYAAFDENLWKKDDASKLKMARMLVKDKSLEGLNKTEIINKLGEGTESDFGYVYDIWGPYNHMVIIFESDTVQDVHLWAED